MREVELIPVTMGRKTKRAKLSSDALKKARCRHGTHRTFEGFVENSICKQSISNYSALRTRKDRDRRTAELTVAFPTSLRRSLKTMDRSPTETEQVSISSVQIQRAKAVGAVEYKKI